MFLFRRDTQTPLAAAAILAGAVMIFAPMQTAGAQTVASIGAAELVKSNAYGTPQGGRRAEKQKDDPVYLQEVVETESDSALHINFGDDTKLRLGSDSRVTLDKFVYSPAQKNGELIAKLSKGAFRYISGKVRKEGVKVFTPTVVIGIRGTDFTVLVASDGSTQVEVAEGQVTITPLTGGPKAVVSAGQVATSAALGITGAAAAVNVRSGRGISDDNGLSDDGGAFDEPANTDGGGGGH